MLLLVNFMGCSRAVSTSNDESLLSYLRNTTRERLLPQAQSTDKNWRPDLSILPYVEFSGSEVLIKHVRNCRYRTEDDYDVRHYDLKFKLDDIKTVDFITVPFKETPLLAHTMLSFGLSNGHHFIISVEARLRKGESYAAIAGATRKYELIYVIGDEQDLIPLRTSVRNVEVFLFPGRATPEQVQDLLVDMLQRANKLQRAPEFYDTLSNNCTTNIVRHVNKLRPGQIPVDWRVVLPGHSDRLAYELGLLEINEPFEIARENARINVLSELFKNDPKFSQRIRRQIADDPGP